MGEVRRDDGKRNMFWRSARSWPAPTPVHNARRRLTLAKSARPSQIWGLSEILCVRRVDHHAVTNLSSNMMAN